jgi:ADP-ribosylglycohydrolase
MSLPADHSERLARARRSLDGLSVGDAFGERFFAAPQTVEALIRRREVPGPPWPFTDDTVMAISIVDVLSDGADIDQDTLAWMLGARYRRDPARGYDAVAHRMLSRFIAGERWFDVAPDAFGGAGSMGNGGAVRASPIGAYFSDDLARAAEAAIRSAHVTHAHLEGQAGAAAVAVAAAWVAAGLLGRAYCLECVFSFFYMWLFDV